MNAVRTLRGRIALAAGAAILAAVVLFAIVTVLLVDHQLRGSLDTALRQRAQDVAQLAVSVPAVLKDPFALESPVSGQQVAVEVLDDRGRLVARSLTLGPALLPQDALVHRALRQARPGVETISLAGRSLRMYAAPIADVGPAAGGVVLVASGTSDIAHTIGKLAVLIALSGAGVVVLAALAAAALTRRSLRPLRELAQAAGEIERTADPSRRLPEVAPADEVSRLTGVLNRMLSSLEQARASERRFLADASHELRTPVTALLGNVEYAARHGADAEVLADLRHDADRLARLVDSLLTLERTGAATAGTSARDRIAVDELVASVAAESGERVHVGSLAPAAVAGDSAALARAVANLVENGLVHGPDGGAVTVAVAVGPGAAGAGGGGGGAGAGEGGGGAGAGARGGGVDGGGEWVLVSVSDAGPGPDPAEREQLFQRFWRGEGTSERPGAGLGLAIVAAIAEQHGGRVHVDGSTFTLELPLAGPQ